MSFDSPAVKEQVREMRQLRLSGEFIKLEILHCLSAVARARIPPCYPCVASACEALPVFEAFYF